MGRSQKQEVRSQETEVRRPRYEPAFSKSDAKRSQGGHGRALKSVIIALGVAALSFLAAFILTVNFYSTWQSFARHAASRSDAFFWGFLISAIAGATVFGFTLFRILIRHKP